MEEKDHNIIKKKPTSGDKLKALWKDKRKYRQRLIVSLCVCFSMCFTFLFFGPVELTAFSGENLIFNVSQVIPVMAIFSAIVFIIMAMLLSLLKGKIFNYTATFLFAINICGYIQGNFLNGNLGALTGDAIAWHSRRLSLVINIAIWLLIFIGVSIVLYLNEKAWRTLFSYLSVALVLMQSVALISIFTSPPEEVALKQEAYLSTDGMFTYSQNDNSFVFLLDRLDYDFIQEILNDDPDFFNKLDGFTSYTNAISEHARTMPAANYILTNCDELAYNIPRTQFFEDSWDYKDHNILKDLKNADYRIDVYTENSDMFGSGKTVKDYVSNLSANVNKINNKAVIRNLTFLSAYRYSPLAFKPFFWAYSDDINKGIYHDSMIYEIDESKFQPGIDSINLEKENNCFKFYHFNGSHSPYYLNDDGTRSSEPTSSLKQTKGSFKILFDAFSKMKELGIYKDASIIITADHGRPVSDYEPLMKETRIGLFYKPSGVEGAPIKSSHAPVSLRNIPATIIKNAGLDYEKYGKPLDEVAEDAEITRTFYKAIMVDKHEAELYTYEIKGDASDFNNWTVVKATPIEYPFY